jgi:hypothetical protein
VFATDSMELVGVTTRSREKMDVMKDAEDRK